MYLAQSIDSCAEEKTCTKLVDLGFSSLDRRHIFPNGSTATRMSAARVDCGGAER